MGLTMFSFKIKILKALLTTNTPPSPQKTMLKPSWIISYPDKTTLTRVGRWGRGNSVTKAAE